MLHCWGNDLRKIPSHDLRYCLDSILIMIQQTWPQATVIWSEILPRKVWRLVAMDKARRCFNNYAASKVFKVDGQYIGYGPNYALLHIAVHL